MTDPLTNYIPPAATIGGELFPASLPINWNQSSGNFSSSAPVTAGLIYRVVVSFATSAASGYWMLIRELDDSGNQTGLNSNMSQQVSDDTQVFELTAGVSTTRITLDILNLDGSSKTVAITQFSVKQIAALTPYINLYTDGTYDPGNTGELVCDVGFLKQDGSFSFAETVFGTSGDLQFAWNPANRTFPSANAYQSDDSPTIIATTTALGVGNYDHILAIVRPPNTDPVVGPPFPDDLMGNVHGQEVIRTPVTTNFQAFYDPLGDGTWIQITSAHNTYRIRSKQVKVVLNTELTDVNIAVRMNSDHTFTLYSNGGTRCDRVDTVEIDTIYKPYFYWMGSFDYPTLYKGRRGHGSTQDGSDVDYLGNAGVDTASDIGYNSSWMALRRNSDNLVASLAYDLSEENSRPHVTGLKSRVWYDPSNINAKLYTEIEFDNSNTASSGTALNSTLWHFVYDPASASQFHAEMATLGADTPSPTTTILPCFLGRFGMFSGILSSAAVTISLYFRPDGTSKYLRPDGTSLYQRP